MAKPDGDLVQRVLSTVQTAEDVDYFFDQLNSPDWIEPLASAEFFRFPPEAISVEGGIQFPPWSASRYLARIASRAPEEVRAILLELPETDNVRVRHDVVNALLAMPPDMAVDFIPRLSGWLESPFQLLLSERAAELDRNLARAGLIEETLSLAKAIFRIRIRDDIGVDDEVSFEFPKEVTSVIEAYEFERLIGNLRDDLIVGTGFRGLSFLIDLLALAMELENGSDGKTDYSWIWRPAIEAHEQNQVPGVRDSIVSAVRDAAVQLVSSREETLDEVCSALEKREWSVLKRISLYVIRVSAGNGAPEVASHLLSPSWIFDHTLHHEYWELLHTRFKDLSNDQRNQVIDLIQMGPAIYREVDGPFGGDREAALEAWQVDLLCAVSDHLAPAPRTWYEELVAKGRMREHPDFQTYTSGLRVGPTSPITDADLTDMSDEALLEYLSNWTPESGWAKPSPEGLGREIEAAVIASPTRFSAIAIQFQSLDPIYVNGLLSGFRSVVKNGESFNWKPILQLSKWVVDQERELPNRLGQYGDLDPGWVWTRSTIAHLLDVGFINGPAVVPLEYRELAWQILEPLTNDPNPTMEEEDLYGGSNMDPSNYAINTVRGQAIEAVIRYSLWVREHHSELHNEQSSSFEQIPEARKVLERHLDRSADASYAVHSIYGQWLPWLHLLDPHWTKRNLSKILPTSEDSIRYWEAAWDAYISFCPAYDSLVKLLKRHYVLACQRASFKGDQRKRPLLHMDRMAQHIVTFYLRGRLSLTDDTVRTFFRKAPPELRASAMRFAGRSLYSINSGVVVSYSDLESAVIERAKALWEARRLQATTASDRAAFQAEIAMFGWWFIAPSFDEEWALTQLQFALKFSGYVEFAHLVVRRLTETVAQYPKQSLNSLLLLINGDKQDFLSLGWESVRDVLRTALGNVEVRDQAIAVTNILGAKGHREFRDLLRDS